MFSKSSMKSSLSIWLWIFGLFSLCTNCSSKIASTSPVIKAMIRIIATQIVNTPPMNTRQATDTKYCCSIIPLPVIISTTPLLEWIPIRAQWAMNTGTRSSPNIAPIAGRIEKMINIISWKIIKCRALKFHILPCQIKKEMPPTAKKIASSTSTK